MDKMVQFDQVEIRHYSITVGDNPACSSGCPISLGWQYDEDSVQISLDDYEEHRVDCRRSKDEMKIPADIRYKTLKEWNVSVGEIIMAEKECEIVRNRRQGNDLGSFFENLKGKLKTMIPQKILGCSLQSKPRKQIKRTPTIRS